MSTGSTGSIVDAALSREASRTRSCAASCDAGALAPLVRARTEALAAPAAAIQAAGRSQSERGCALAEPSSNPSPSSGEATAPPASRCTPRARSPRTGSSLVRALVLQVISEPRDERESCERSPLTSRRLRSATPTGRASRAIGSSAWSMRPARETFDDGAGPAEVDFTFRERQFEVVR